MLISNTRKFSGFTKLFRIMGLLRITKLSRGETASSEAPPFQDTMVSFPPELAQAMRLALRQAKEENINIEDPIEGDVGL